MALSRSPSLFSSSATSRSATPRTPSTDNDPGCASVLDMDDTSSCAEIELDPPSHPESGVDKTQPEHPLFYSSAAIDSSESLPVPSTLPDQNLSASKLPGDQVPSCRDIEPNVPQGRPVNLETVLPPNTAQHRPDMGQPLSWLTSMIEFLSQFNKLKDDHYSLLERVKRYEDAFGKLTDKVQKFTADLLLYHFGPTGLNNGAADMHEARMGSFSTANLQQFEHETEHTQRTPCATDGFSVPISGSTLQDMDAGAAYSGSEYAKSAILETGATVDHTHSPIILRLKRGPTIARTSMSPTRRSARLESAKDAAYISRKVNATVISKRVHSNRRQKK